MAKLPPKSLVAEWDSILKKDGFVDIEDRDSPNEWLKTWHSQIFANRYNQELFHARQHYFEMATHFLHSYEFDSELEREVWFLHSEGKSLREIARATGKVSKDGALKIIHRLTRAMKDGNTSGH